MILRLPFLPLAVLTLASCASGPQFTVDDTRCNPASHHTLVGMNIGEVYLPMQLEQRVISPGQFVNVAYRPERLTLFVDPKGWIGRVSCG